MRGQEAVVAGMMGFLCVVAAIAIVIAVFYLLTLQKALSRVRPHNRLMEPGLVWLSLIPLFNIVWSFFIATRIPDSLANEFRERRRDDGSDYGRGIGLANAILGVVSIPLQLMSMAADTKMLGLIQLPLGLASLVLFIIFWVRIAGYSGQLAAAGYRGDRDLERDDDDYRDDDYRDDDYRDRGPRAGPSDAIRPEDRDRYRE
jgi:hypothetical protein